MKIDGRSIGPQFPPYIIAEMSANHNGSIENAFKIIEAAKYSGASAVKLQTYRPDTITLDCDSDDFTLTDGLWAGRSLYDLYSEAFLPWEWHSELFDFAKNLGITIFSSPFDHTAVDLLEDLNTPAYKIASFEAVDLHLIKYAASTGKPLIISTGMANFDEISEAVAAATDSGCQSLALLLCVSGYPASPESYNLATMVDMADKFNFPIGLSDHTLDNTTAIASVAMGANIVEKHFTLDRNGKGPDDSFSLEPDGLSELCIQAHRAWQAVGSIDYGLKSCELGNVKLRRSLYFVKELAAGSIIDFDCVRSVRPGYGLPPKFLEDVIGSVVTKDVKFGTPVSNDLIGKRIK